MASAVPLRNWARRERRTQAGAEVPGLTTRWPTRPVAGEAAAQAGAVKEEGGQADAVTWSAEVRAARRLVRA